MRPPLPPRRYWAHAYPRLCTDGDRRVRAAAQRVLAALLGAARGRAAPFLPLLVPALWLSAHDAAEEAREGARAALDASFPAPARRARLLASTGGAVCAPRARARGGHAGRARADERAADGVPRRA